MALRWAQSAAKHGISQTRVRYVLSRYQPALVQPPQPPDRPDAQIVYLGADGRGVALEIMTVRLADGSELVIHAMKLRKKYYDDYQKVMQR